MNRLLTNINGGFPYRLDDIRWEQDAYRLAFADLCKSIGLNFILYGCEVTDGGTTWNVSEGAVVLNGEICHFTAGNITKHPVLKDIYLKLAISYDPSGTKTFLDTTSNDTYQIRKATLVNVITFGDNVVKIVDNDIIMDEPFSFNSLVGSKSWITLAPSAYQSGYTQAPIKFQYKMRGNMIEFRGSFVKTSGSGSFITNMHVATLPPGYRPQASIYIAIESPNPTDRISMVEIQSNGEIHLRGDLGAIAISTTSGPYISGSFAKS